VTDKDIIPVLANNMTDLCRKGIEGEQFATMLKNWRGKQTVMDSLW